MTPGQVLQGTNTFCLQLTPQAMFEDVKDQVQLVLQKYPQSAGNRQLEELSAAHYRLLRLALLKN